MRVAVAGGTGLVGRYTVEALEQAEMDVVVLARSRGVDLATGMRTLKIQRLLYRLNYGYPDTPYRELLGGLRHFQEHPTALGELVEVVV